jgi:hypothetical protein
MQPEPLPNHKITETGANPSRGVHFSEVCQLFCVNDQVLFLGWEREGRATSLPAPSDVEGLCAFMTPPFPGPASVTATES